MSTWRRQLSTFERSVSTSAISVISLMASRVRASYDEPCPPLLAPEPALTDFLRLLERGRVDAAQKLLQTGLEDRALRLRVGTELVEPAAYVGLELADSRVQRTEPFVALALEDVRR